MAVDAAGRVAAKVSTVATRTPSIRTSAIPQSSQGKPIQLTPVPVKVNVAVAPAADAYTARSPLSVTPTPAPVVSDQAPAGASVAARSEEHTSELQSQFHLVCRLLHEDK